MSNDYYNKHANIFYKDTFNLDMSDLYRPFLSRLPAGSYILDAGCGTGRDSLAFLNMGYKVDALDASEEMVRKAIELTGIPVEHKGFDSIDDAAQYDGIWACASLLHVTWANLPDIMFRLCRALKNDGVLYVSFKYGDCERQKDGRHFTDINEARLSELTDKLKGVLLDQMWLTVDKRPDHDDRWLNALFVKKMNQKK